MDELPDGSLPADFWAVRMLRLFLLVRLYDAALTDATYLRRGLP